MNFVKLITIDFLNASNKCKFQELILESRDLIGDFKISSNPIYITKDKCVCNADVIL